MKKVLHLTLYLDIGGLERMIWNLTKCQLAAGWSPAVLVYERDTGELLPQFQQAGIPVAFRRKGRGFSFKLLFQILSYLRQNETNFIHSHDLGALIYATLVKILSCGRVQVVHTQHTFHHLKSRKLRFYEKIFPWIANRVVCVSEDLRRTYLRLGQPLERLRIVPNGVDFSLRITSSEEKAEAKRELIRVHSLPPEIAQRKWVITLGRLASIKGPQHALAIWNLVDEKASKEAAFLFVGPENDLGLIEHLRKEAKREVFFPGPSLDPQVWLRAADLFVSASEFEGLPMAALEAVAARLPMALSRIPGHGIFSGWAAFFSHSDPQEGAKHIETFLRQGNLGTGTESPEVRAKLEATCGARKMTERYLKIYREVFK